MRRMGSFNATVMADNEGEITMYNDAEWTRSDQDIGINKVRDDFLDDSAAPYAGWWILPMVGTGALGWFAVFRLIF